MDWSKAFNYLSDRMPPSTLAQLATVHPAMDYPARALLSGQAGLQRVAAALDAMQPQDAQETAAAIGRALTARLGVTADRQTECLQLPDDMLLSATDTVHAAHSHFLTTRVANSAMLVQAFGQKEAAKIVKRHNITRFDMAAEVAFVAGGTATFLEWLERVDSAMRRQSVVPVAVSIAEGE